MSLNRPPKNKHATHEEMLAGDDEVDYVQSFGSTTDHYWKSIKAFSKQGCVQDMFVFTLTMTFSKKRLSGCKQTNRSKINFSVGFILRNRTDGNFRHWYTSNSVDRMLDQPSSYQ